MDRMTTTVLDRFVRWNLDFDGDLYGDERERLRWYEGTAVSHSLQSIALPWAAAILIWPLGRPAIVPLGVLLTLLVLANWLTTGYVSRRRVETVPRHWSAKRILFSTLTGLPFVVFCIGVLDLVGAAGPQAAPPRGRDRRGRGLMAPPTGPVRAAETDGAAGTRIRAVRKGASFTQQTLAAAVEVSRQTIIAMETGDYAPSVYLAIKIARALDTTVEALWAPPE
jgi:DNA-binding XRE family transcriptional regulator